MNGPEHWSRGKVDGACSHNERPVAHDISRDDPQEYTDRTLAVGRTPNDIAQERQVRHVAKTNPGVQKVQDPLRHEAEARGEKLQDGDESNEIRGRAGMPHLVFGGEWRK